MARLLVDIDSEALAEAAEGFGTATATDTVNAALRAAVARHRRAEAFDRLCALAEQGDFDELLDKKNYRPRPSGAVPTERAAQWLAPPGSID